MKPALTPPPMMADDPIAKLDNELKNDGVPVVLDPHRVAEISGKHYQSVWKAIQCGRLKAAKNQGRWLVRRSELAAWLLGL